MVWRFFNPKLSVGQKHQNLYITLQKYKIMEHMVSQMNLNDNQVYDVVTGMSWRHHDMTLKVTSWLPSPFAFQWNKWYRLDPGVDFTIFEAETQKWWTYLRRTHAWPGKWLWRHDFRDLSYFFYYIWHVIDIGVDFTIFETEKLKNDKRIYVELTVT